MKNKTTEEALFELKEGNLRFVQSRSFHNGMSEADRQRSKVPEQMPFAVILGCSDSRVPAEIVFDQSVGDLFVIRVAGNVVAPSQVGSIEYAIEMFQVALVVVLGHSHCGAVAATLEAMEHPNSIRSRNIHSIVERIQPAIEPLHLTTKDTQQAVTANINHSVKQLGLASNIIQKKIINNELRIVGAFYHLENGKIDFFD